MKILKTTLPNRKAMAALIERECNIAIMEVSKVDGIYALSKTLAENLFHTAGLSLDIIREFAKEMPGGFVTSNPFYNTLLIYLLTFCATGTIEDIVYKISRYYTAVTLSNAKRKFFPFIDANLLQYTLMNSHGAVIAKNGWGALVVKVADETLRKYIDVFKSRVDLYVYYRYIVDVHNKINQSVKHIAWKYYANSGKAITTDIQQNLNNAVSNIEKVCTSSSAIEYISSMTGMNELEVERICNKINDFRDVNSTLQNMILIFLRRYTNKIKINDMGLPLVAGRGLLMEEVCKLAGKTLEDVNIPVSKDNIRIVIYIALLTIMYME